MSGPIHVVIDEGVDKVRTVPTDFVTCCRIVRSAKLAGKGALIVPWTRGETREWTRLLDSGEALVAPITIFAGTCPCTVKPTGEKIKALVPLAVVQGIGSETSYFLEPLAPLVEAKAETIPPGTDDDEDPYFAPPDLKFGQATEGDE